MKLPENIATPIRQGLRLKRRDKGDQDYKLTPEEFRIVVNDAVVNKAIAPTPPITLYNSAVGLTKNSRKPDILCRFCKEHHRRGCPKYNTLELKQQRLQELGLCKSCGKSPHTGNCNMKCIRCHEHHWSVVCTKDATQSK